MQRKTSQTWRRDYGKTIIKEQVILVGAADNNKSRQLCHRVFYKTEDLIYIDSGNSEHTGQVVCGIRSGGRTIACMYYAYGKLDKLQKLGLEEATDDFFMMYYELLDASADFVCSDYNEYYNTSRWYFSFKSMMEYYRLCRDYCNKRGVSLKANPYMREAELAVDRIMSLNHAYGYGYRLNTRINHQWASGIVLETDEYFGGHEEVLEALLCLDEWFRQGADKLKDDLHSTTVIPFPAAAERKEAA